MNRPIVLMLFVVFITLIFLQFSCGTIQEYRTEEIATEVEETVEEASLLAGKHQTAGIECNDCHGKTPPDSDLPEGVCLSCHEDYRDVATSYYDPHNAHYVYSSCGDCHHAHWPSQNQCMGCHNFDLQAP